jgi:hydrogenase nickel incorporation protein HypA/HybF
MHELSIAVSIVDLASKEVCGQEGDVIAVHLSVGTFSGVEKESLLSAWPLARRHSPLENAELVVTEIGALAYCPMCNAERGIASMQQFCCAECGAPLAELIRGRELEITALEFDT